MPYTEKITLELTQDQCVMIRDSLNLRIDSEQAYRNDLKRFSGEDYRMENLLQLSERNEDQFKTLVDLFHKTILDNMLDWVSQK
jgi:type I restriction-modification system DNA methylase subunit